MAWFVTLAGMECEGRRPFWVMDSTRVRVGSDKDGTRSSTGFLFCGMTGLTTRWASVKEGEACACVAYSDLN